MINSTKLKGLLILYEKCVENQYLYCTRFITNYYIIISLEINHFLSNQAILIQEFKNVELLEIIITTHTYFPNNEFNFEDSTTNSCTKYFKAIEELNVKVVKFILVTTCNGIFAHEHIKELKEGSIILTLSTYNTLTYFSDITFFYIMEKQIKDEKNILLFLILLNLTRKDYKNQSFFHPIASTFCNKKLNLTHLMQDIVNLHYYSNIRKTLQMFLTLDKNSLLSNEYYKIIKTIFDIKCSKKVVKKKIPELLRLPINSPTYFQMQIENTQTIPFNNIAKDFEVDSKSLRNLYEMHWFLDFPINLDKDLTLNIIRIMIDYFTLLHCGMITHALIPYKK